MVEEDFILRCRFNYNEDAKQKDDFHIDCESVYLHGSFYEKIFDGTLKNTNRRKRFVKITNVESGKSIWRTLRGVPTGALSQGILYVNSDGRSILEDSSSETTKLTIKKSCWLPYYWNTDNTAARVSFKMGIISFGIGIVSFLLGIVQFVMGLCA
ncbi:MAG: hypothetical protein II077_11325 [Treponema sp.]|nr:hypothetical protein [Treponema sp.]